MSFIQNLSPTMQLILGALCWIVGLLGAIFVYRWGLRRRRF